MEDIKSDCEFYIQHYAYSPHRKRIAFVNCGHCVACRKSNCKNCQLYKPKKSFEEEMWLTINSKIDIQIKELRLLQSSLCKYNLQEDINKSSED